MTERDPRPAAAPPSRAAVAKSAEPANLRGAAADFVGGLGRKVSELRVALEAAREIPDRPRMRDELRRKLHALSVGARMLRFDVLTQALTEATNSLDDEAEARGLRVATIESIATTIDRIPELAWHRSTSASQSSLVAQQPPATHASDRRAQLIASTGTSSALRAAIRVGAISRPSIVVPAADLSALRDATLLFVGRATGLAALTRQTAEISLDIEHTEDLSTATDFARALAPDVIAIDLGLLGALELIEALVADPLTGPLPIVAFAHELGADEGVRREALRALGVTLVDRMDRAAATCARAIYDVRLGRASMEPARAPLGDLSVRQISERLAEEVRRALTTGLDEESLDRLVSLGVGAEVLAPLWTALAQVRDVVRERSHGSVTFANDGRGAPIALSAAVESPRSSWPAPAHPSGDDDARNGRRRMGSASRTDLDVSLIGRKILVADDDPAVLAFIGDVLAGAGAEVITATDGFEALQLARALAPEAIVSDVLMPRMDGLALARTLRRDVVLRDRPVVLVSWKEDLLSRLRGLRMETHAMLRKESDGATLLSRMREVLRPRVRIEARLTTRTSASGTSSGAELRHSPEVRGRLDDLSIASLLSIVSKLRPVATVVVRDAVNLFKIELENGSIRSASCTSLGRDDVPAVDGRAALLAALGVLGGRFLVRSSLTSGGRAELLGDLESQLKPLVRRLRAAGDAVSGAQTVGVASITIDAEGLASYASATPPSVQSVLRAIVSGRSPRSMILAGEVAPAVLEDVLTDIASRGLITAIVGVEGEDLLARAERLLDVVATPLPRAVAAVSPKSSASSDPLVRDLEALVTSTLGASSSRRPSDEPRERSQSPVSGGPPAESSTAAHASTTARRAAAPETSTDDPSVEALDERADRHAHESARAAPGAQEPAERPSSFGTRSPSGARHSPVDDGPKSGEPRVHSALEAFREGPEKGSGGYRAVRANPAVATARPRAATLHGIAPPGADDVVSPARFLPFDSRAATARAGARVEASESAGAVAVAPVAPVAESRAAGARAATDPLATTLRTDSFTAPSALRHEAAPARDIQSGAPAKTHTLDTATVAAPAAAPRRVAVDPLAVTVAFAPDPAVVAARAGATRAPTPADAAPPPVDDSTPTSRTLVWTFVVLVAGAIFVALYLGNGTTDPAPPTIAPAGSASR